MSPQDVARLYRNMGKEPPAEFGGSADTSAPKRTEKYGRKKKECQGVLFDSTLEADCWPILKLWESCGEISSLERQPVFILEPKSVIDGKTIRAIKYVADFIFQRQGRSVVVDAKGIKTPAFSIKAKLFKARFPQVEFEIWDRSRVKELSRC